MVESADFAADVLEPPEVLGVESITAEGVTLRLRVKTKPGCQLRLQRVLRAEIKEALEREGIALAHHATGASLSRRRWQGSPRSPCHDDAVIGEREGGGDLALRFLHLSRRGVLVVVDRVAGG